MTKTFDLTDAEKSSLICLLSGWQDDVDKPAYGWTDSVDNAEFVDFCLDGPWGDEVKAIVRPDVEVKAAAHAYLKHMAELHTVEQIRDMAAATTDPVGIYQDREDEMRALSVTIDLPDLIAPTVRGAELRLKGATGYVVTWTDADGKRHEREHHTGDEGRDLAATRWAFENPRAAALDLIG